MKKWNLSVIIALMVLLPQSAVAQIRMSGVFAFNRVGSLVTFGVQRIDNYRSLFSVSGTLSIQLWATVGRYSGSGTLVGYKLTEAAIGTLRGGYFRENISTTQRFIEPPPGVYNIVFVLAESNGFTYELVDSGNFSSLERFGPLAVAPTILTQPRGFTLDVGQSGALGVAATGTEPFAYQWYRNGARMDGETQSVLIIREAQASDAGTYSVVVVNIAGAAQSDPAVVRVNVVAPSLGAGPVSQTVVAGSTVRMSVSASGSPPMSYQWRRGTSVLSDGGNVSGATTANITLANVQSSDAGNYTCIVANSAGSATSSTAILTVNIAPQITSNPTHRTIAVGGSASLSVVAVGTGPLTYQWKRGTANVVNGAGISGATTATLTFANAQAAQSGDYSVVVSNSVGAAVSEPATLSVLSLPTIAVAPTNRTVAVGSCAIFVVQAAGSPPFGYRWKKGTVALVDGPNISGSDSSSLSLCNVQAADVGGYSCTVTNAVGSVNSVAATLTVNNAPLITSQPTNRIIAVGGSHSFSVVASGTGPLVYQWKRGSTNLLNGPGVAGATTAILTLANVQLGQSGQYSVAVSNSVGSTASQTAVLTVLSPPTIAGSPTNRVVAVGSCVTFGTQPAGSPPFEYRWRKGTVALVDGPNISGSASSNLSLCNVQPADAGSYSCSVSNLVGGVTSSAATLTVNIPPLITGQPTNRTIAIGNSTTFSVVAAGTGPLTYQWKRGVTNLVNGAGISGATTPTLTLANVQTTQAGEYSVVVTNSVGVAASQSARLDVVPLRPVITEQPASIVVLRTNAGAASATFTVTALGVGPLSYQWRLNGTNLPGRTGPSLIFANARRADAGTYSVVVSNASGSTNSLPASLRVLSPALIRSAVPLPDGKWRLTVGDSDGSAYLVGGVPALEMFGVRDLSLTNGQWSIVGSSGNAVLSGGNLIFDIPSAAGPQRFFRVIER